MPHATSAVASGEPTDSSLKRGRARGIISQARNSQVKKRRGRKNLFTVVEKNHSGLSKVWARHYYGMVFLFFNCSIFIHQNWDACT